MYVKLFASEQTTIGRATVRLLNMNAPQRIELREQWLRDQGENH